MVQILSASTKTNSKYANQIASEVAALAQIMPGKTARDKHFNAIKVVERLLSTKNSDINRYKNKKYSSAVLKIAEEIIDKYERSHTPGPGSDLGNQPAKDIKPNPDVSTFQNRAECIQSFVNNNFSLAAATARCNEIFGPTNATTGAKEVRKAAGGSGFSTSSVTTTYYPSKSGFSKNPERLEVLQAVTRGKAKSASVNEIPAHVWSYMSAGEIQELETRLTQPYNTSIKSAAQREAFNETLRNDAAYALSRIPEQRRQRREQKDSRLRQASNEGKPAWLLCHESMFGET